jgi:hypothetical protein
MWPVYAVIGFIVYFFLMEFPLTLLASNHAFKQENWRFWADRIRMWPLRPAWLYWLQVVYYNSKFYRNKQVKIEALEHFEFGKKSFDQQLSKLEAEFKQAVIDGAEENRLMDLAVKMVRVESELEDYRRKVFAQAKSQTKDGH